MDKLTKRLRRDADAIDVNVSAELDHRIAASLQSVTPGKPAAARKEPQRPVMLWWASSLTGVVAAAAVIVLVNSRQPVEPSTSSLSPVTITTAIPVIDWNTETAVLTAPLQQELVDLQSDIRKAEEKVRLVIGM